MSAGVLANLEAIETTLDGVITHTLKRKSRRIILTNDSGSADLKFKFNSSEDFATLKPTESMDEYLWVREVRLSTSTSVAYRLWVYG